MARTDTIMEWKNKNYQGDSIYLKPISTEDLQFIVDMRNQDKSKHFLNQTEDSTLESQKKWFAAYEAKNDEIYWIYCDKETGRRLGTIRLYNFEENECEMGSSTADSSVGNTFFAFMEAHSLALQFAKEILQMSKMHLAIRTDNKFVDTVLRRLGFEFKEVIDIRGVEFNYLEMEL